MPLTEDQITDLKKKAERNHHSQTLKPLLSKWHKDHTIPPVLLLTGPRGIGKMNAAHLLAQWILCENPDESLPCEVCTSCKKIVSHQQPHLLEIPLDDEHLKIDDFRKIKSSTSLVIHESPYQVVLLPDAHRMTHQAANSILKLLEEPPSGWIFILTTDDSSLLPATVISRCQQLPLRPFSQAEVRTFLDSFGLKQPMPGICSKLAQGSLTRALLYSQAELWNQRKELISFFSRPAQMLGWILEWILKEDLRLDLACDLFESHLSELIQWSVSDTQAEDFEWSHADLKPVIIQHIQQTLERFKTESSARSFWIDRVEAIGQMRKNKAVPLNRKILVQGMLLPWLEVGAR